MKSFFKKFLLFFVEHLPLYAVCTTLIFVLCGVFMTRDSLSLYPDFSGSLTKDSLVDFAEDIFVLSASVGAVLSFIFDPLFELFFRFLCKKYH